MHQDAVQFLIKVLHILQVKSFKSFKDPGNDALSLDRSTHVEFLDTNILCYDKLVYRPPIVIS